MTTYDRLPPHMRDAARAYIEHGRHPGQFLTAALENNLVRAFSYADETNRAAMFEWACWLYNDAPGGSWGSPEHVKAWIASGGLAGETAPITAGVDA